MSTITNTDVEAMRIQIAVDRALSNVLDNGSIVQGLRQGSSTGEISLNGQYDADDEFTEYFMAGDVVGVNPVSPD